MDKISQFQHKLLTDAHARKEFAANPTAYLRKHHINLPAGTKVPDTISETTLETTITTVHQKLTASGLDAVTLRNSDAATLSKFVEDTFKSDASAEDLNHIKDVIDEFGHDQGASTERASATVAGLGVVVVAVVAVPVAVFGAKASK